MQVPTFHAVLCPSEAATHSNALGASIYCVPQRLRSHMPHPASEVQGVQSPILLPPVIKRSRTLPRRVRSILCAAQHTSCPSSSCRPAPKSFPPPTSSLLLSMPDFRTSSGSPHRVGADTQASPAQLFSRSQLLVALLGHAQTPHSALYTLCVPISPLAG